MSTAVAERLDSSVTRNPPPCEIKIKQTDRCGKPSAYKLHRECECGISKVNHVCESCYFSLIVGKVICHFCCRYITDWKVL